MRKLLTRREFVALLSAASALPSFPRPLVAQTPPMSLVEVAPGVYVHQGRHAVFSPQNAGDIANCGVVIGTSAVAVIDTSGSARSGAALNAAVAQITDRPVTHVINTHMHPDHVFGNAAFASLNPAYVAHHKMARGLAARAERYLAINRQLLGDAAFEGTRIVLPNTPVADRLVIDLGGRTLTCQARRTAHTDNDLTVMDDKTGTLFLGDLLFSGHVPTLDGSIRGWLALLAELRTTSAARVVPGHGPAAMDWPSALDAIERYWSTIATDVRAMIKTGRTLAEAAATAGLAEKDAWELFSEYHPRNVSAAFAELEWE